MNAIRSYAEHKARKLMLRIIVVIHFSVSKVL